MSALLPRTIAFVCFAMLAFAANSLFCRLALGRATIDAATFTLVRLGAGAVVLVAINFARQPRAAGVWTCNGVSALALFVYAGAFSLAYRQLPAGTGALLLFGAVQATMLGAALLHGEHPRRGEWLGLLIALAGLVYLISPGLSAPPAVGSALMVLAGIAWGVYSLRGRKLGDPLANTAANFVWAVPLAVLFCFTPFGATHVTSAGVMWAVLSGALASGLGYAVWYSALPALTATRAATVQLTVPVIAAFGGVTFLGETISARLILASLLVLGGVGLAILSRQAKS
ncbi:MAG: DMT family transporter [Opitutaceae bacterium]